MLERDGKLNEQREFSQKISKENSSRTYFHSKNGDKLLVDTNYHLKIHTKTMGSGKIC